MDTVFLVLPCDPLHSSSYPMGVDQFFPQMPVFPHHCALCDDWRIVGLADRGIEAIFTPPLKNEEAADTLMRMFKAPAAEVDGLSIKIADDFKHLASHVRQMFAAAPSMSM